MPTRRGSSAGSRIVHRRLRIALVALVVASPASAQFTTFIAPPSPVKDSLKAAVVAEQKSVTDSITHAQITDMKTWVDSAAGIAAIPPIDTTLPARTTTGTTPTTTSISTGVVAPS